jgi:hypothetical protein
MDNLSSMIQKIRLRVFESRRIAAKVRKQVREQKSEAAAALDMLADRIALEIPLKPRDECPQMTDAEYKRHVQAVIAERTSTLIVAAYEIAARREEEDHELNF